MVHTSSLEAINYEEELSPERAPRDTACVTHEYIPDFGMLITGCLFTETTIHDTRSANALVYWIIITELITHAFRCGSCNWIMRATQPSTTNG